MSHRLLTTLHDAFPTPYALSNLALWLDPSYGTYKDMALNLVAGSSQYLSIADNASLRTGNIDFWYSCWVRFDSLPAGIAGVMGKYDTVGNKREYTLNYNNTLNRFQLLVSPDGTVAAATSVTDITVVAANTWYLVLCWHDSVNNTINIKVNNNATQSVAWSSGVNAATDSAFSIGRSNLSSSTFMSGGVDSAAFGKSPVGGIAGLISTIHTRLYNGGNGLLYSDLTTAEKTNWGLVSWWNLDETTGDRLDSHGTNHLPAFGSPVARAGITRSECAVGDPVSKWLARTGQLFEAPTNAARPTLRQGANGRRYLEADGVDDRMVGDSSTLTLARNTAALAMAAGWKADAVKSGSGAQNLILFISNNAGSARALLNTSGNGTSAVFTTGGRRLDADSFASTTGGANDTAWKTQMGVLDYANSDAFVYANNVLQGSNTSFQTDGNTSDTDSSASGVLILGGSPNFLQGSVTDIVVYRRAPTANERAQIHNYLVGRIPT